MSQVVVDTYCVDVDAPNVDPDRYGAILSREERDRARQFHFEHDRRRYVARTGILRELIGSYLNRDPADVAFTHNAFGKPAIAENDLRFNLSHSQRMALYAFSRGVDVGCDIERRDSTFAVEQIPERFFSRAEVNALRSLPLDDQTKAFFNCWTRKEAYVKAIGHGLSIALDSFDVSLAPGEPAALLRGCEGWSVQSFEPTPGFQAAIVAQGANWRLSLKTRRTSKLALT